MPTAPSVPQRGFELILPTVRAQWSFPGPFVAGRQGEAKKTKRTNLGTHGASIQVSQTTTQRNHRVFSPLSRCHALIWILDA